MVFLHCGEGRLPRLLGNQIWGNNEGGVRGVDPIHTEHFNLNFNLLTSVQSGYFLIYRIWHPTKDIIDRLIDLVSLV
jgi:hypothetical protein